MSPLPLALTVLCLAAGAGSALARSRDRWASGILKMVAAGAFLALALSLGARGTAYGRGILTALLLSAVGDGLLLAPGRGRLFLAGLGSFLLAHVAYGVTFAARGLDPLWTSLGAAGMVLVGGGVLRWLGRAGLSGRMLTPVRLYVVALGGMAAGAVGTAPVWGGLLVPVGALAFVTSDLFVARERFVHPSPWNGRIGLPVYFLSQTLLAWSVAL